MKKSKALFYTAVALVVTLFIASCDSFSISFTTFTNLTGDYSGFTAGSVSGPTGGSMTLTADANGVANIACPGGYVIPVSNANPSQGNSSIVTCNNNSGCNQVIFQAEEGGGGPQVGTNSALLGASGGVENDVGGVVRVNCVPSAQASFWS